MLPVLFGVGGLALIFSIAKRLADREVAWIAVAVAISIPEFTYLTVSLRPYPFGFFFGLATRILIAWVDSPNWKLGVAYALTVSATVWSVYFSCPSVSLARAFSTSTEARGEFAVLEDRVVVSRFRTGVDNALATSFGSPSRSAS